MKRHFATLRDLAGDIFGRGRTMERYSLIVVADETAPIRRFDVLTRAIHRVVAGVGVVAVLLTLGLVDYVQLRIEHPELETLRTEVTQQRARLAGFQSELEHAQAKLAKVRELERKIRIIANIPGAAGAGGDVVGEAGSDAVAPASATEEAESAGSPEGDFELTLYQHGIDGTTAIMGSHHFQKSHLAGMKVDVYLGRLGHEGVIRGEIAVFFKQGGRFGGRRHPGSPAHDRHRQIRILVAF